MSAGGLRAFGPELWLGAGAQVEVIGFRYPTRMAVIRLASGELVVWSPVALSAELRQELETLGEVRHLIAPNSMHHLFLADWQEAYPAATLHAAPGLADRRPDLKIDHVLGDAPAPAWAGELDQVVVAGNRITTEVVFFHRASGTVLFTDLLQQFPPGWFRGWRALVARLDLMTGPAPAVPRKFRMAFTDRTSARAALGRILEWPSSRLVIAHGAPVEQDGRAAIAAAFRWLTG